MYLTSKRLMKQLVISSINYNLSSAVDLLNAIDSTTYLGTVRLGHITLVLARTYVIFLIFLIV